MPLRNVRCKVDKESVKSAGIFIGSEVLENLRVAKRLEATIRKDQLRNRETKMKLFDIQP